MLFLLAGRDRAELDGALERVAAVPADALRRTAAALGDDVARRSRDDRRERAAFVASSREELAAAVERLQGAGDPARSGLGLGRDAFAGRGDRRPRICLLFSGQAAPVRRGPGALAALDGVPELYELAGLRTSFSARRDAQLAVVVASLAALAALDRLGVRGDLAVGHSLGELTALHWSGALGRSDLLRVVRARARAMLDAPGEGAMASLATDVPTAQELTEGVAVRIACFNAPGQQVVSGPAGDVDRVVERARARSVAAVRLPVTGAFHSELMRPALAPLAAALGDADLRPPRRSVVSTVTGDRVEAAADLRQLLCDQLLSPVRFVAAVERASDCADLAIEVGPGAVLSGLARKIGPLPAFPVDAGGESARPLLRVAGAAFAAGVELDGRPLRELAR